ncbi:cleavage and polyadenylation specificity factor subunit 1-like [Pyrus ussuriensis x Pyrus communis]|uniref:Cleavage and polyadenylation specificity factor subunit 1-like n=1 Tax=Pyrus ussuriensis x Pyrus communis TaxID=2448454 RepID=A0A5N5F0E0_9ROSA|nr:cleavage and polyadenylation specificity factor subunit 1-like [Pyrus ussuriensis x Pyrus communis]
MHGNVVTMAVLSGGGGDGSRRRDSIVLTFEDAKISVLEFDDSIHGLRTSSMHCFEGPEWLHLRRGRESFARGPLVKGGSGLVGEDDGFGSGGYIEPVMVILHEQKLTWAGRVSWKHHTCMISALSISTTLKQRPLIWSALIWQERNLVVFQNKIPNHTWIVKSALNRGREFVGANGIIPVVYNGSRSSPPSSIRCSPVNARFVKLNFDGSVVNQGAAVGFVIRNEKG